MSHGWWVLSQTLGQGWGTSQPPWQTLKSGTALAESIPGTKGMSNETLIPSFPLKAIQALATCLGFIACAGARLCLQ